MFFINKIQLLMKAFLNSDGETLTLQVKPL